MKRSRPRPSLLPLLAGVGMLCPVPALADNDIPAETTARLSDLSLEELMQVEITSVSKKAQKLADVPAAVFVISQEDIRRSGATSIPEALRLAPGVDAARISGDRWAVSIRGFNGRFANKLQVLVDGRSVYTPLYSGVFWENQDLVLEDIERIEVIRGPGASIWGANAVNGVINIITKQAGDTLGGLLSIAAGSELRLMAAARYGVALDEHTEARFYLRGDKRDEGVGLTDAPANDSAQRTHGGLRLDRQLGADRYSVFADAFSSRSGDQMLVPQLAFPYAVPTETANTSKGWNLMGRWERRLGADAQVALQAYVSHTDTFATRLVDEQRDTFDVDFHHSVKLHGGHDLNWGLNYRRTADDLTTYGLATFPDSSRALNLFAVYLQDEFALTPDTLRLTLGARAEHHDYTGWELQPNARLLWHLDPENSAWLSAARASRTPSRGEHDASELVYTVFPPQLDPTDPTNLSTCTNLATASLCLPVKGVVTSSGSVDAEHLDAFELGYRSQWQANLSGELVLYHHRYTDLIASGPGTPTLAFDPNAGYYVYYPYATANGLDARLTGFEAALDWRPRNDWRLQASYTLSRLTVSDDSLDGRDFEGNQPRHILSLRAGLDLTPKTQLDLWVRHVGARPMLKVTDSDRGVEAHTTLDLRLAWKPRKDIEISLVGQNLLESAHLEYVSDFFLMAPTQVERSAYAQVRWQL